jgi:hypothetical protein
MNRIIRDDIYRQYILVTWLDPPSGLKPEMAFYVKHFLMLRNGLIVQPPYKLQH